MVSPGVGARSPVAGPGAPAQAGPGGAGAWPFCLTIDALDDVDGRRLVDAIAKVARHGTAPTVLVLANEASTLAVMSLLRAGAGGVLLGSPPRPARPPWPTIAVDQREVPVSPREVEVLALVAQGMTNRRVAAELGLSPYTVKNHLARLARRTGTSRRQQLIDLARQSGLIG